MSGPDPTQPPPELGNKKLTLVVSPAVSERLNAMANRRGITTSELIRRAVALQDVVDQMLETYGSVSLAVTDKTTNHTTTLPISSIS